MSQGIKFTINTHEIEIATEYRGVESPIWDNGNHPAFDVFVKVDGQGPAKFDFFGSIDDFNKGKDELEEWEHCSIVQNLMSEATSGEQDFEDFCDEFGYEDTKEARKTHKACVETFDKFDQIFHLSGDELNETYNAMIDQENSESRYGELPFVSTEMEDEEEVEFEPSRCEQFNMTKINWWEGENENLTANAVRQKYEDMKEPMQAKREALQELEYVIDSVGEYDVKLEAESFEKYEPLQFDDLLVSEMGSERSEAFKSGFEEKREKFLVEFRAIEGKEEASEGLVKAFADFKDHIEEGIGSIESSVGVNFEENEFDESMASVVDGWYPIMNSAWRLDSKPSEDELSDLIENAPNASIVNIGDEYYITMNGGGTDLSQDIAYAYLKIDGDIPKELGVCRTQHLSASNKAFEAIVKHLNDRDMKEMAAKGSGKSLNDVLGSMNKSTSPELK